MKQMIPFSYEKTNQDFRALKKLIEERGKEYEGILAVANGGLAPAYYLAKAFDLPVECVNVKSYTGTQSGELFERNIEGGEKLFEHPERILLVDDIYDSGKTLDFLHKKYPQMDIAVPYVRWQKDESCVDFFVETLGHEEWIEFPWEKDFY